MKTTFANKFWFVLAIFMVCSFGFISCTTDDDDYGGMFSIIDKPDENPRDTTTTPEPKDSIDWNTDMEKTFGFYEGQWPSTITVHYTGGKDTIFHANLPMSTRIEAPAEVLVAADAVETRFSSLEPTVTVDSTEWVKNDADGYYYRTITRSQVGHMNNYDFKVISTHAEAYMVKEGKVVYFKHGQEGTPYRWNDTPTSGEDIQRDGKTYSVENAFICMQHKLHALKTEYPEATTRVLREKVTDEPVVTMPNPELKIKKILNIPNYTLSPEWMGNSSNDKVKAWHKVLPVLATAEDGKNYYFIWVDGSFVAQVAQGSENKIFNSAYFAEGSWRPASLEPETNGWRYVFVVNGTGKMKSVDQNMTLCEDIKNFAKSKDAAQTPSIYTEVENTEYSGRVYAKVKGFNIDMKSVIETTIGEVY